MAATPLRHNIPLHMRQPQHITEKPRRAIEGRRATLPTAATYVIVTAIDCD